MWLHFCQCWPYELRIAKHRSEAANSDFAASVQMVIVNRSRLLPAQKPFGKKNSPARILFLLCETSPKLHKSLPEITLQITICDSSYKTVFILQCQLCDGDRSI